MFEMPKNHIVWLTMKALILNKFIDYTYRVYSVNSWTLNYYSEILDYT